MRRFAAQCTKSIAMLSSLLKTLCPMRLRRAGPYMAATAATKPRASPATVGTRWASSTAAPAAAAPPPGGGEASLSPRGSRPPPDRMGSADLITTETPLTSSVPLSSAALAALSCSKVTKPNFLPLARKTSSTFPNFSVNLARSTSAVSCGSRRPTKTFLPSWSTVDAAGLAWPPSPWLAESMPWCSRTLTRLPQMLWLSRSASSCRAPAGSLTKPKFRDRPVPRSTMTCASSSSPYLLKCLLRSSSSASGGRPPTKSLTDPLEALFSGEPTRLAFAAGDPSLLAGDSRRAVAAVASVGSS
mmetsp:Transcript_104750/g.296029  ORF Transcript_104750/g.296029 Transcript_104750/m.296029 type:complete len:301 (+) Transcript_104750:516-1418(+)